MDYRNGIDVMTTETACLSSVWQTDDIVKAALAQLGRADSYKAMAPAEGAYYDGLVEMDLSSIRPMIALPFHPSNAYSIADFKANMADLLHQVDKDAVRQLELKTPPPSLTKK
jgi:aconitate hydratase